MIFRNKACMIVIFEVILYPFSYLEAVNNREPTGILLRIAKNIDSSPALLARNVLEKYCTNDNANANGITNCEQYTIEAK